MLTPAFPENDRSMRLSVRTFFVALGLSLLAGCVTADNGANGRRAGADLPTPNPHAKIGNPYTINGIRYTPRLDPTYDETGITSWYGPKFHAKLTANGELFDQNRLTAAHKTMPLPSLVRVTNVENGRSAVLRVNDRGPFAGSRIIDLSKRAAEVLGTKDQGLGTVRVEYLGAARLSDAIVRIGDRENYAALHAPSEDMGALASPAPRVTVAAAPIETAPIEQPVLPQERRFTPSPAVVAPAPSGYYVRIGTFADVENVRAIRAQLPSQIPVHVSTDEIGENTILHHVKLGPYTHEFAAVEAKRFAQASGYEGVHIVRETLAQ